MCPDTGDRLCGPHLTAFTAGSGIPDPRSPRVELCVSGKKSLQASVSHVLLLFSSYVTGASPDFKRRKSIYAYAVTFVHRHRHIFTVIYRIRTATVSFVLYSLAPSSMYHNVTRVRSCSTQILSIPHLDLPLPPSPYPFEF